MGELVTTKQMVQCANCGGFGHIYKNCNHPITSYGIICFRLDFNPVEQRYVQQYLMVQRKDSLSYVEFIRGKYTVDQKAYLLKLFSNMTIEERTGLATLTFDVLWKSLWQSETCKSFVREYNEAKSKFEMLRQGYIMKNTKNEVYYFDIDYIVNNTVCNVYESEWGFPKGRRNINEPDFACAVREFKEETGIQPKHIRVIGQIKPLEEVFSGTNKVRYKHVYYVATSTANAMYSMYHANKTVTATAGANASNASNASAPSSIQPRSALFNPCNKMQSREIKDVKWFDYKTAQGKINNHNIERKELFKRVDMVLQKLVHSH